LTTHRQGKAVVSSNDDDDDGGGDGRAAWGDDDVELGNIKEDEEWVDWLLSFLLFLVLYAKGGEIRGVNFLCHMLL
jgi:hypothetical protein